MPTAATQPKRKSLIFCWILSKEEMLREAAVHRASTFPKSDVHRIQTYTYCRYIRTQAL